MVPVILESSTCMKTKSEVPIANLPVHIQTTVPWTFKGQSAGSTQPGQRPGQHPEPACTVGTQSTGPQSATADTPDSTVSDRDHTDSARQQRIHLIPQ